MKKNKNRNLLKQDHSPKEHAKDSARNDTFNAQKEQPQFKDQTGKVPHGKYFGKKWFPQGD